MIPHTREKVDTTDLVLRCKPLSDEQRERWRDLWSAFEGETEDKTHATLLLAEVLGAFDDAPAVFTCLLRDVGMCWEQLHYEITTPYLRYRYEWMECMSDSAQLQLRRSRLIANTVSTS
jgi:hypothetical protein